MRGWADANKDRQVTASEAVQYSVEALRGLVGSDAPEVRSAFEAFVTKYKDATFSVDDHTEAVSVEQVSLALAALKRRTSEGRLGVPEGRFVSVSMGSLHACGLRSTGEVECWGRSDSLGERSDIPSGAFKSVGVGETHAWGHQCLWIASHG